MIVQGNKDARGMFFWNAPNMACCNFLGSTFDDIGYLIGLIDEMMSMMNIDHEQIYVAGHSNGGFTMMSFALACTHSDRIAVIADLASAMFSNPCACCTTSPMSVLHIHRIRDELILYSGGALPPGP
jgi:poly(3-hydroxybutyrate) depolymerase